jgi:hypothetical protein
MVTTLNQCNVELSTMSKIRDFIFVRHVKVGEREETSSFYVFRKSALPDLSEHACLGVRKDGMEEWVPKDQFKFWKKIFDSINEVNK